MEVGEFAPMESTSKVGRGGRTHTRRQAAGLGVLSSASGF